MMMVIDSSVLKTEEAVGKRAVGGVVCVDEEVGDLGCLG